MEGRDSWYFAFLLCRWASCVAFIFVLHGVLHLGYVDELSRKICYLEMPSFLYSMVFWLDWSSLWLRWLWLSDLMQNDAFRWECGVYSIWKCRLQIRTVRIMILGKARYHCLRLYIDMSTIFKGFLSWKNLFETVFEIVWESFEGFRTVLQGSFLLRWSL